MDYFFFRRSLAVGSKNGFSLFSLNSIDSSLEEIYTSSGEEINIVERLFSSSLVAVVSLNAPRKLKVLCHLCSIVYSFNWILFIENIYSHLFGFYLLTIDDSYRNAGVSFQKRNGNMQLFIFEHNSRCKVEPSPVGGMPGREFIHT